MPWRWVWFAVLRGHLSTSYFLFFHLVRYYLLLMVAAGFALPGLWLFAGFAVLYTSVVDFSVKRPRLWYPTFLFFYLAEHSGVPDGCAGGLPPVEELPVVRAHLSPPAHAARARGVRLMTQPPADGASITVKVHTILQLVAVMGGRDVEVELPHGSTLGGLFAVLSRARGDVGWRRAVPSGNVYPAVECPGDGQRTPSRVPRRTGYRAPGSRRDPAASRGGGRLKRSRGGIPCGTRSGPRVDRCGCRTTILRVPNPGSIR